MSSSGSSVKASSWHAASKRTSSSTSRKVVPSASRRRFSVRRCMASISATASPEATRFSNCTRSERRSFSIRSGWAMAFACASRLRSNTAIGTGHRPIEPVAGEAQGVQLGVEAHRAAEQAAVGAGIGRRCMGQQHFAGHPGRPAQLAHEVDQRGQHAVVDLARADAAAVIDGVAEFRDGAVPAHEDHAALAVEVVVDAAVAQRVAHRGRVAHQLPQQPQVLQPPGLAQQQPEVVQARVLRAAMHEPAEGGIGNAVLGQIEGRLVQPGSGQHRPRIDTQLAQQPRRRLQAADTLAPEFFLVAQAGLQMQGVRVGHARHSRG